LEKEDDDYIYFNWLYKCVLLSIIYFNQDNEEESRYQYIDGIGEVQQMKKYFENISQNDKVEILKKIIKYLSGIKKYNPFNLLW
jgi:ssDNA-specific exonuclease RecJ